MRISGQEGVDFGAWASGVNAGSPRVLFRVGRVHCTGTPQEASEMARQLLAAVAEIEARDD